MGTLGTCPGPPDFFFFLRGPQLAVEKLFFKSNYLITFAKINSKRNPVNTFSRGPRSAGGAHGPNAGKDATDWIFVAFASYRKNIQLGPARIHGPSTRRYWCSFLSNSQCFICSPSRTVHPNTVTLM